MEDLPKKCRKCGYRKDHVSSDGILFASVCTASPKNYKIEWSYEFEIESRKWCMNMDRTKTERHMEICQELNAIYEKKNHDYGDSFHKTFVEWGPAAAGIRMVDKLNRFNKLAQGNEAQVNDESIVDTLKDLANYAIMTIIEFDKGKE